MTNTRQQGDPAGTGWRAASWMALGLAVLLASLALNVPKQKDIVTSLAGAVGLMFVFVVGAIGLAFGIFGAAASAAVDDKRFVVILPVWANAAFLFGLAVYIFSPK